MEFHEKNAFEIFTDLYIPTWFMEIKKEMV